ncbi:GyrI-like domain-containing protein [Robiginitalea sp. IMCC43444]|uniref:GyrI-like domain-containing protein n=1 Tax=Robiginitalea sp. IMCC43444 TaxID=3459121 RepID=UPI0040418E7F
MNAEHKKSEALILPPNIRVIDPILLVGKCCEMSLSDPKTLLLWSTFMPLKNSIENQIPDLLYSVEIYPEGYFESFDPQRQFVKWAAVAAKPEGKTPHSMESLNITAGLYAIFRYKGLPEEVSSFYRYIFTKWLFQNSYKLDSRPHFSIMGKKYRNGDPHSEEDIYIPVIPA